MKATHIGEVHLLYSVYHISPRNTSTDTPRVMFNQISGCSWPAKLTHKIITVGINSVRTLSSNCTNRLSEANKAFSWSLFSSGVKIPNSGSGGNPEQVRQNLPSSRVLGSCETSQRAFSLCILPSGWEKGGELSLCFTEEESEVQRAYEVNQSNQWQSQDKNRPGVLMLLWAPLLRLRPLLTE